MKTKTRNSIATTCRNARNGLSNVEVNIRKWIRTIQNFKFSTPVIKIIGTNFRMKNTDSYQDLHHLGKLSVDDDNLRSIAHASFHDEQ